jgi:hypothetical protein
MYTCSDADDLPNSVPGWSSLENEQTIQQKIRFNCTVYHLTASTLSCIYLIKLFFVDLRASCFCFLWRSPEESLWQNTTYYSILHILTYIEITISRRLGRCRIQTRTLCMITVRALLLSRHISQLTLFPMINWLGYAGIYLIDWHAHKAIWPYWYAS